MSNVVVSNHMLHRNGVLHPVNGKTIIEDDVRSEWPTQVLLHKALKMKLDFTSKDFASALDDEDRLSSFRSLFDIPKLKDVPNVDVQLIENEYNECLYFNGGSMGLKPKSADEHIARQLELWRKWGSFAYVYGKNPVVECDQVGRETTANLIGAKLGEVALMNALTVNLHLLMVSFYRPVAKRHKILIEFMAFSSDMYAIKSQIQFHGYDPEESLVIVEPREGEKTLRPDDILDYIEEHGDSIAVVIFSGVHYYTGQKFDMEAITNAGHNKGCLVGFDLAHAVGNVKLELHNWNVDFATWCSYKYLNSGPAGVSGIFVHQKHDEEKLLNFKGWWGNKLETRFNINEQDMDENTGAERFKISNTSPWSVCLNRASLDIFEMTNMDELTDKQFLLTGYLELLVNHYWPSSSCENNIRTVKCSKLFENNINNLGLPLPALIMDVAPAAATSKFPSVRVLTPADPNQRGNQMSLTLIDVSVEDIHPQLQMRGIAASQNFLNSSRQITEHARPP